MSELLKPFKIFFRILMALIRSLPVPFHSLGNILLYSPAVLITAPDIVLPVGVISFGRLPKQLKRLLIIPSSTFTVQIAHAKIIQSPQIALFCRFLIP